MRYSLTTKISVVFAIALTLVCVLFYTFASIQLDNTLDKIKQKQLSAINYLVASFEKSNPPSDLTVYFKNFGLTYVKNDKFAADITNGGKVVFAKQTPLGLFLALFFLAVVYQHQKNRCLHFLLQRD